MVARAGTKNHRRVAENPVVAGFCASLGFFPGIHLPSVVVCYSSEAARAERAL